MDLLRNDDGDIVITEAQALAWNIHFETEEDDTLSIVNNNNDVNTNVTTNNEDVNINEDVNTDVNNEDVNNVDVNTANIDDINNLDVNNSVRITNMIIPETQVDDDETQSLSLNEEPYILIF